MLLDIERRAPEDRPFIRYVGAIRANQGYGCSGGAPGQAAFVQLVNAISLSPEVVVVGDAIEDAMIYTVDLRAYGWTAPIDVDGPAPAHFDDRWSAIVAAVGPYALELEGPEADALKQATQTPVPFLSASAFVAQASVGPLYAALVGLGSDVGALATSLGVDDSASVPQRAGIFGAEALPDRVVTRRDQGAYAAGSWWTREELRASADGVDIGLTRDPVHYPSAGAEVIFSLPNGLFAFAVYGADGHRLDELACTSELPCAGPTRALTSVTCRACHGGQPMGAIDEVLPYLDADPTRYTPDLVPLIREQYRADLWRALEADRTRAYTAHEAATGLDLRGGDIANTYHEFENRPLDALAVANDLGVQVEQLRAAITALSATAPELAPLLTDGKIDRDLFTSHFQELACAVEGPRNQPSRCP
jgi:serine/threonine-protein kinase